jgi:hypothetical protein
MFHPGLGRFLQQDPKGFEASDENLYRFVENNPVNNLDPSGLQTKTGTPYGCNQPSLWYWDNPDSKTDGVRFSRAWGFGDDEMLFFRQGCIGLCSIRTGSYLTRNHPQNVAGVKCFSNLKDALAEQKKLSQKIAKDCEGKNVYPSTPVLFAVESSNDISAFYKYLDKDKKLIDPKSLVHGKLEPYDFATAFQKSYDGGAIVYWERMPYGVSKNPNLIVNRTKGHVYKYVVYCVKVANHPLRPHPITKPLIPFGKP